MSRYRRKRVLFVCIGNACRSPMAEAIARHDASDAIDAFSAGLAAIGFVTEMTKKTLMRNGYWVEDLESKAISPKIWEQVDLIINMSGRPKDEAFREYSKVEDWEIEDPYGEDPEVYLRVFEKIRVRVAELAQRCRDESAATRTNERRAHARVFPAPPIFISLNGEHDAQVLDISEGGLALSSDIALPNRPLRDLRMQFLGSSHSPEVPCQIAWRSKSNKQAGIQFVSLTDELRWQIRNWISAQACASESQEKINKICEQQNAPLETPDALQIENTIPGPSDLIDFVNEHGDALLFSPAPAPPMLGADAPVRQPETYANTGIGSGKKSPPRRPRPGGHQRSPGALRQRWGTLATSGRRPRKVVILVVLIGLISLAFEWVANQRHVRTETISSLAQKTATSSEAVKPIAPSPAATTPDLPNRPAEKAEAQTSIPSAPPTEEIVSVPNASAKNPPARTKAAKKPPVNLPVTPSHPSENLRARGRSPNELPRVAANVNVSPIVKTQQATPSLPPAPPQLETRINPVPLLSNRARPAPPESKANSTPPAKQPGITANITGAVTVLADPYPSLRIPNANSSKKQRQGASLQLGHLLSRVEPVYPEEAKQEGIQGTVRLHAIIDRHGSVDDVQSVGGSPILAAAAMSAVRHWRYTETLLAGKTVETEEDIAIVFRLSNPAAPKK